jgi:hypothetical protein
MELMPQQMRDDLAAAARALAGFDRANVKAAGAMRIILNRHAVDHARAVLAKWGHQPTSRASGCREYQPMPRAIRQDILDMSWRLNESSNDQCRATCNTQRATCP